MFPRSAYSERHYVILGMPHADTHLGLLGLQGRGELSIKAKEVCVDAGMPLGSQIISELFARSGNRATTIDSWRIFDGGCPIARTDRDCVYPVGWRIGHKPWWLEQRARIQ